MTVSVLDTSSEYFSTSKSVTHWRAAPMASFDVRAVREHGQWVAKSKDIPGLNLECDSLVELVGEIREWGPELLIDNQVIQENERFTIVIHSPTASTRIYN